MGRTHAENFTHAEMTRYVQLPSPKVILEDLDALDKIGSRCMQQSDIAGGAIARSRRP